MKVDLTYWVESYNTLSYDLNEEVLKDFVQWCFDEDLEIDEFALQEYLSTFATFEEDVNTKNTELIESIGVDSVISKCKEIANDFK